MITFGNGLGNSILMPNRALCLQALLLSRLIVAMITTSRKISLVNCEECDFPHSSKLSQEITSVLLACIQKVKQKAVGITRGIIEDSIGATATETFRATTRNWLKWGERTRRDSFCRLRILWRRAVR